MVFQLHDYLKRFSVGDTNSVWMDYPQTRFSFYFFRLKYFSSFPLLTCTIQVSPVASIETIVLFSLSLYRQGVYCSMNSFSRRYDRHLGPSNWKFEKVTEHFDSVMCFLTFVSFCQSCLNSLDSLSPNSCLYLELYQRFFHISCVFLMTLMQICGHPEFSSKG